MRIVSICPSNTETLAYLGLEEQLVGIDDYSDWPASVNDLPRLGPDLNIDMDKLEDLKPDLVFASLSVPGMEKNIQALRERNIPHVVSNPNSLQEIAQDLLTFGEAVGIKQKARQVYDHYNDFLEQYRTWSEQVEKRPSLYWEWWAKPVFTPGAKNWLTPISTLAGGYNIFSDKEEASVQTDWQDVYDRNPDYVCLVWVGVRKERVKPHLVRKRPGWEEMAAVAENRLHVLDEPLFCRPSPRFLTGLQNIAHILHADIFPAYQEGQDALLTWMEQNN
jgi:iron complex transport system substrate-binding protein